MTAATAEALAKSLAAMIREGLGEPTAFEKPASPRAPESASGGLPGVVREDADSTEHLLHSHDAGHHGSHIWDHKIVWIANRLNLSHWEYHDLQLIYDMYSAKAYTEIKRVLTAMPDDAPLIKILRERRGRG